MNIAVLFDGAGLARLGLERAGHTCTGIELDPAKHFLSRFVGSGNCILADVRNVDLSIYDAIWASPPCQWRSSARTQGNPISQYADDLLTWSLGLAHDIVWVENVLMQGNKGNDWGIKYNAHQFLDKPIQNRTRIIGGRYSLPSTYRPYSKYIYGLCPAITATEWKGCATDTRRASRYYGRKLTIEECAYHQGFEIPKEWYNIPETYTKSAWYRNLYEAIGNGVPVYMSYAFGEVYR